MTDRHAGYVVTLDRDIREDDAQRVIDALRMVKGVLSVEPVIGNYDVHIAEERAGDRWRNALRDLAACGPDA